MDPEITTENTSPSTKSALRSSGNVKFLNAIHERLFGSNYKSQSEIGVNEVWRRRWDAAPDSWKIFLLTQDKVYGLTPYEQERIDRNNCNYVETPQLTRRAHLGTSAIILTVGAMSKLMLRSINTLHCHRLCSLHQAIENRPESQGLLTFSNHRSVMDDPFLLGALIPPRILINARLMRWGLCSSDICFQDSLTSRTLRLGKALPIFRRGGISQPFLRDAANKLAVGDWVHIFPEGRVRQDGMGYFKRGIGKMLAMSHERCGLLPMLLPVWHTGIEQVMPQKVGSNELESLVPKRGQTLHVFVGEPVDVSHIFDRLMPECQASGGTKIDAQPCIELYEEVADFLGITMRLLRAEARRKARVDHGLDLGAPYEFS